MNSRSAFVAVGLGVNALVLVRGVVLMLALELAELGLVALVQAAIIFIGMLHFGLLNGGYRLLCHAGPRTRQRLVDLAYTGLAMIGAVVAVLSLLVCGALGDPSMTMAALFAVPAGMATLLRAWIMNEMVAGQRLRAANTINAGSNLVSLAVLLGLLPEDPPVPPVMIALAAMAVQPIVFVAMALVSGAALRPRAWRVSRFLARIVMRAGFRLFLAGLVLQMIPLIERAYVSRALGLVPLGRLYLAFLFVALFQMAPNLIQQAILAPVVEKWRARDAAAIQRELRHFLWALLAYCAAVALALAFVAEPLLALVLAHYVADLRWVYLIAPGLIAFTLTGPFTLGYNVVIDYRWFVWGYTSGAAVMAGAYGAAMLWGVTLNLDQVVILRSAVFAMMGAVLVFGSRRLTMRAPEFRLFVSAARPA